MTEAHATRRHPEYVVLDIGDGVGALILHADAALHGVEVEISPVGRDDDRSHKDVLERSIDGRPAYTAVFDQLAAGTYTLWTHGVARARGVVVTGGEIAQVHWPVAEAQRREQPRAAHHQRI
jgi:hypothetical protein